MNEWDFAVVGIHGNVYNWLVYGTVNGVIHSEIASYAYFQNACLKHLKLFGWTHIIIMWLYFQYKNVKTDKRRNVKNEQDFDYR